ncbi:MAG: hypothetical protein RQ753_01110 [Desulfurivibrionaceae bacterium]|nr:hypothetical protein [Desulfobulbales bacterium]MDT8334275.1 hypothetical protein [Desulfurivibrionaceae bacterium]
MTEHEVIVFKEYPLREGQKIHIADGFRHGDWQVVKAGAKKIRLRCPVSGLEIECDKSYYFVEERRQGNWPAE